jgi:hypothetical protein
MNRLLSALVFGALSVLARGQSMTQVSIYQATEIGVRVDVYDPPIHLRHAEYDDARPKPDWYPAFFALMRPDMFSFRDWMPHFTPDFIEANALTEAVYRSVTKDYDKDKQSPGLASILWSVYVDLQGRHFCLVTCYDYAFLDKVPIDTIGLKYPFFIRAFERIDGVWKNEPVASTEIAQWLPLGRRNLLEQMMRDRAGVIQAPNKHVQPISTLLQH